MLIKFIQGFKRKSSLIKTNCFKSILLTIILFSIIPAKDIQIGITVSGGTSYGSYQAGCLYVANDWIRFINEKGENKYNVRVVTGTSAGSINAILAVLSLADTTTVKDTQSLFYKTWIPISYEKLKCGDKSALAVFGRAFFDTLRNNVISPHFHAVPSKNEIDLVLGLSTTCLSPTDLNLTDDLYAPTIEERFSIRMTKDSESTKWKFRNFIDSASKQPVTVLPLEYNMDGKTACSLITNIAYASTGIPGAFDPIPIKSMQIIPSKLASDIRDNIDWADTGSGLWKSALSCSKKDSSLYKEDSPLYIDSSLYVDGGVFDKSPLRFAIDVANKGLKDTMDSTGSEPWRVIPKWHAANPAVDSMKFIYLCQDNTVFPELKKNQHDNYGSLMGTFKEMMGSFIKSAHSKELAYITERFPNCSLFISKNYTPLMSGYLFDLLGFFEEPFRIFDFYTGMYDARKFLSKHGDHLPIDSITCLNDSFSDRRYQLTRLVLDIVYSTIDSLDSNLHLNIDRNYWKPKIDSVNNWFMSVYKSNDIIDTFALKQHAIMLQTSIDRLWLRYMYFVYHSKISEDTTSRQFKARNKLVTYRPTFFTTHIPILKEIDSLKFYKKVIHPLITNKKRDHGSEFDVVLYLLDKYEYTYKDIVKDKQASASEVKSILCSNFLDLVRDLAKHQEKKKEGRFYSNFSKPLMNLFTYTPPEYSIRMGIGIGGLAVGYGHCLSNEQYLNRFQWEIFGLIERGSELNKGISTTKIPSRLYPSFSLNPGFLFDIYRSAAFQLRYGVSGSFGKNWRLNSTSDNLKQDWTIGITPLVLQGSLYETLYLRFSYGTERPVNFANAHNASWDRNVMSLQIGWQRVW
jgi:predicted acylesterase/phospholipase RssA